METDTCTKCGYSGPISEFFEPGRRHLCKPCRRQRNREGRVRATSRTKAPVPSKACSGCGVVKSASEYVQRNETIDGLDQRCKHCRNAAGQGYWERTRDRRNALQRDRKYGLRDGDYDGMYAARGGVCAICLRSSPRGPLVVDHCHRSGAVRALLCGPCNQALGLLNDDPIRARQLTFYLDVLGV